MLLEGAQIKVDTVAYAAAELSIVSLDGHLKGRSAYLVEMDLDML